jgi:hypothetical protein
VTEAGGRWSSRRQPNGKIDVVLGSPPLVEQLAAWLEG